MILMNKTEFINIISNGLCDFPEKIRKEIIADYEEHFSYGTAEGKTEPEIINELGDPYKIVKSYRENYFSRFNKDNNNIDNNYDIVPHKKRSPAFWIILIIILVMASPVIIGVSAGIFGLVFGILAACVGIFVCGLGFLLAGAFGITGIVDNIMNININIPVSSQILLGIGTICLAILIAILFFFIIKLIIFLIKQLINCFK